MTTTEVQLPTRIDQDCSVQDLRSLCFTLDVGYDNLVGHGRAANTREPAALMQCHSRLPDLITHLRRLCPFSIWSDPTPPPDPALAAIAEVQQRLFAQVKLLLVSHLYAVDMVDPIRSGRGIVGYGRFCPTVTASVDVSLFNIQHSQTGNITSRVFQKSR